MKIFIGFLASIASGVTIAQSLPLFGTARFGNAVCGAASTPAAIPIMPLWLLVSLTLSLGALAYFFQAKEHVDR